MKRTILMAAILPLALVCLRAEDRDSSALRKEIEGLEQKTLAVGLLRKLGVTAEQAKELLPLAEEASAAREEFQTRLSRLQIEESKTFGEFRDEDLKNVGFTTEVERATAKLDDREKSLSKAFSDHLAELEARVPFTEAQKELISRLRPENLRMVLVKDAPAPGSRPDEAAEPGSPKAESERLRKELEGIHRDIEGGVTPLGRLLTLPILPSLLAERAGEKVQPPASTAAPLGEGAT